MEKSTLSKDSIIEQMNKARERGLNLLAKHSENIEFIYAFKLMMQLYVSIMENVKNYTADASKDIFPESLEKKYAFTNERLITPFFVYSEMLETIDKICSEKDFDISSLVNQSTPYRENIIKFLNTLKSKGKIHDLAYLVVLLKNIQFVPQKFIAKEYKTNILTIAAGETNFAYSEGIKDGKTIQLLNLDQITITIWTAADLDETIPHELAHVITQPFQRSEVFDKDKDFDESEAKVENYLQELDKAPTVVLKPPRAKSNVISLPNFSNYNKDCSIFDDPRFVNLILQGPVLQEGCTSIDTRVSRFFTYGYESYIDNISGDRLNVFRHEDGRVQYTVLTNGKIRLTKYFLNGTEVNENYKPITKS